MPHVGMVVAAADPAKSQQLWNQMLSIPSIVMGQGVPQPTTKTVAGQEVQVYPMPEGINIPLARVDNNVVIGLTEQAIGASIEALRSGASILTDETVRRATDRITDDTSILLFAHAGRCAQIGAQFCSPSELPQVQAAAAILQTTILTVQADESPTRLRIAGELTGLPKIKDVIDLASKFMAAELAHNDGTQAVALDAQRSPEH